MPENNSSKPETANTAELEKAQEQASAAPSSDANKLLSALSVDIQKMLAFVIISLTFFMYWHVTQKGPDKDMKEIVVYVLGALTTIATQVVSYYFGSSSGSVSKSKLIDDIASKQKQIAPALPTKASWLSNNAHPVIAISIIMLTFFMYLYVINMLQFGQAFSPPEQKESKLHQPEQEQSEQIVAAPSQSERITAQSISQKGNGSMPSDDNNETDQKVKEIIIYILGALTTISTQVVSYYFGSSTSSVSKSKVIDDIARKKA